jgi:hypothetical protein
MATTTLPPLPTVARLRHRARVNRAFVYMLYGALMAVVAYEGYSTSPKPFALALTVLLLGAMACLVAPRVGVLLTIFLALCGDEVTSSWYPFTKNFSSAESVLFVSRGLIFSPLELYLVLLIFGWMFQRVNARSVRVRRGVLNRPILAFTLFALGGLVRGLSRGGSSSIALWEIRPTLYFPVLYVLAYNLLDRDRDYQKLYALLITATSINGLIGYHFIRTRSAAELASPESLLDHAATLPMNMMALLAIGAWLIRGAPRWWRWALPPLLVPVMLTYLAAKRRAGFVGLFAGLMLLGVVLLWTHRARFLRIAPVVLVVFLGYCGAFWNSESTAGFPAQAVKSVIAPSSQSRRNQDSDVYRYIETADIKATIRASPLFGVGYGQKFLRPIPLPAIAQFLLAEYRTHNSVLWIWMKMGAFGFLSMVVLFGVTLRTGARVVLVNVGSAQALCALASTSYVFMYVVFAYVDIAWDARTMVLMGLATAHLSHLESQSSDRPLPADLVRGPQRRPSARRSPPRTVEVVV